MKMSEVALNNDYQRKCKKSIVYITNTGNKVVLDSSWELLLAEVLDGNNIKWGRPEPLKWVCSENKIHNYYPDFYLNDYDLYLDPKNPYCFEAQKEKIRVINKTYDNVYFLNKEQLTIEYIKYLIGNRIMTNIQ